MLNEKTNQSHKVKVLLKIIAGAAIVTMALWFGLQVAQSENLQTQLLSFGYIGAFLISVVSGFNLVVPIPAISFLPALTEAGLDFWISILVITAGMTVGDSIGYILGRLGRNVSLFLHSRVIGKLESWRDRHFLLPLLAVFIFAAIVPLPNEIIVIPAALIGYKFGPVFLSAICGNLIFNILTAFGLVNLFSLLIK